MPTITYTYTVGPDGRQYATGSFRANIQPVNDRPNWQGRQAVDGRHAHNLRQIPLPEGMPGRGAR